jgi:hypothetical protein
VKGEDVLNIGLLFFGRGAIVTKLSTDWVSVNKQNVWQDLLVTARSGMLHRTQSTSHAGDGDGLGDRQAGSTHMRLSKRRQCRP